MLVSNDVALKLTSGAGGKGLWGFRSGSHKILPDLQTSPRFQDPEHLPYRGFTQGLISPQGSRPPEVWATTRSGGKCGQKNVIVSTHSLTEATVTVAGVALRITPLFSTHYDESTAVTVLSSL